ncbi:isopentenyl transferase family protein [Streptomyces sp. NPDC091280]|uniref:isopentenyl transferase family protein n=1 Tax=Streptomyces sp. NPDC091280 TaxID=3365984 RepID=UPI00380DC98A
MGQPVRLSFWYHCSAQLLGWFRKATHMSQEKTENDTGVYLVVGATGVGKSDVATALARAGGAPVVVADRIQCFTDLATTSARAGAEEPGVNRFWLGDRTVLDGDYPAAEAAQDLIDTVAGLSREHPRVIIEGGSVSLLQHLAGQLPSLPWRLTVRLLPIPDRAAYLAALTARAHAMLMPVSPHKSLLAELAAVWRFPSARAFVASVNGLEAALEWCTRNSIDPARADALDLPAELRESLARLIAVRHLEHGEIQHRVFTELFQSSPAGIGRHRESAA